MKFNPHDILKKYPDFEDIASRLEQSEQEAKEKNKSQKSNGTATTVEDGNKRVFQHAPEHALITHFYKDGRWEQSPLTAKAGRKAFLEDLFKILESRNPDAVRVLIFRNKTEKSGIIYNKDIFLDNEKPEKTTEHSELGAMEKRFDEKLEQFRKNPDANNLQIEILRKEFEARLAEQKHLSEINELKHYHQAEINNLQNHIAQRDEYIDELEEELEENEGELNGLKTESQKEKDTPLSEIVLGRVLSQTCENLLKQNPKILKIGLGLSEDEIKKIWEKDTKEISDGKTISDNSSFSESTNDDYKGLDENTYKE